jgi:hypothetical protein
MATFEEMEISLHDFYPQFEKGIYTRGRRRQKKRRMRGLCSKMKSKVPQTLLQKRRAGTIKEARSK